MAQALDRRPLGALGISEAEESCYRWLLNHPDATAAEIAQGLASTLGKVQRLLGAIEAKGLVTSTPERPRRYIPVSPDIAIKALALQYHQTVQRAEEVIPELQEQAAARPLDRQELMVELITSREAERQIFEQMDRTAQHEIVTLTRLPLLINPPDVTCEHDDGSLKDARSRGVRIRDIVDSECLTFPGMVDRIREDKRAGEEIRVVASLPTKLVIADHRIALLPLDLGKSKRRALLVRSSGLLDSLYALFELFWERASPITFSRTGALEAGVSEAQLSEEDADLVMLFAAGLNDKKIADELGISTRTLNRRLVAITKELGARSRFQMGWLAALRLSDGRAREKTS